MNKFKRGSRAELGVYDDWMHGDDSVECVVSSPEIMNDKFTAWRHSKILDELNDKYIINFEYKQTSLEDIIDNIIKELDKAND